MTRAAFFKLLAVSVFVSLTAAGGAHADDALIYKGLGGGLDDDVSSNLATQLGGTGLNTTTVTSLPGSLSPYQQIWDVRFGFAGTDPISGGEQTQYVNYLQSGGAMFVMGENSAFTNRNNSVVSLITAAGGGTPTFASGDNAQDVLPAAQTPNPITTIGYLAPGGITQATIGTGQCLTRDSNNVCSAIAWGVGSLTNAPTGSLVAVFDINFMQTNPGGTNTAAFLANLIRFVTVQSGGGGSDFAALGSTPYQRAVGGAFNTLFGNTSGALSSIMANIAGMGSLAEQQNALEVSANSFPQIPFSNAFVSLQANLQDVARWTGMGAFGAAPAQLTEDAAFRQVAAAGPGPATDNLHKLTAMASPASSWTNGNGLSAFLNLGYIGGDHDATTNQAGFLYDGFVGTGGVAYDLCKNITVGGGIGINRIVSNVDNNRSSSTTGTYNLIAFGRYADGSGLYADATANIGYVDYSYDRNISVGAFSATANGSADGVQSGASVGGGYDFALDNGRTTGVMKNVVAGPFAQLQYQYGHLGGFTETGAGTASLKVGSQNTHSLSFKFGGRLAGEVASSLGAFVPSLTVAYEREFLNGSRSVDTSFVGGAGTSFATPVDRAQQDFALVGLGVSKDMGQGLSAALAYNGRYNTKDVQHAVTLRGKLTF